MRRSSSAGVPHAQNTGPTLGPTPAETVRAALDDAAFDAVRLALAAVKEGPLAAYSFVKEDVVVVPAEEEEFEVVAAA